MPKSVTGNIYGNFLLRSASDKYMQHPKGRWLRSPNGAVTEIQLPDRWKPDCGEMVSATFDGAEVDAAARCHHCAVRTGWFW
jgi:hypothetical protein